MPYKVCQMHTKEALEKLIEAQKPTVDPNAPAVPGTTTPPAAGQGNTPATGNNPAAPVG